MPADRKIDLAAGAQQFIGDLRARGAGAYHQHRTRRQLLRRAIGRRVDLQDPG
jgi:hypothetical protein